MIVQQRCVRKCPQSADTKLTAMSYSMRNEKRCRGEVSGRHTVTKFLSESVAFILLAFAATLGMKMAG